MSSRVLIVLGGITRNAGATYKSSSNRKMFWFCCDRNKSEKRGKYEVKIQHTKTYPRSDRGKQVARLQQLYHTRALLFVAHACYDTPS